jgi:hypothetical protein
MTAILKEATAEELILANQRNLLEFFKLTGRNSPEITYFEDGGIEGLYSPEMPAPVLNRVIRTDVSTDEIDRKIKEISHLYKEQKSPLSWEVWPTSNPAEMEDKLNGSGFRFASDYPAMIINLDQIDGEEGSALEVRKVENEKGARILADLFQEIYQLPDMGGNGFYTTLLDAGFDQDLASYIGYENGIPVCISSVYYKAGVAGIYNVGTKKDYCRKGYGKEITNVPLLDAKNRGYQYGILQSSDQGEKVYQRMGFKEQCRVKAFFKYYD